MNYILNIRNIFFTMYFLMYKCIFVCIALLWACFCLRRSYHLLFNNEPPQIVGATYPIKKQPHSINNGLVKRDLKTHYNFNFKYSKMTVYIHKKHPKTVDVFSWTGPLLQVSIASGWLLRHLLWVVDEIRMVVDLKMTVDTK